MERVNDRIKTYRNKLHLSQEYVATYLGVNRATVTQMELGKRNISAGELSKLSLLFGVSSDELLYGTETSEPAKIFARSFTSLSETDQAEIMNLIRFKEMMKVQRSK